MTYKAPVQEMLYALRHNANVEDLSAISRYADMDLSLFEAVLEEAGKLASDVIAPLNHEGDKTPARLENGVVRHVEGTKDAYSLFCDGGWNGLPFPEQFGGGGLPWSISTATNEMWQASNLGLSVCSLLTQGAIEAMIAHGSDDQKATYLENLVHGRWSGTMCLTEPQAGTDVGALKTKAVPEGDAYRITGTKIYISFGEHELSENIIHLVLARLPDGAEGTRGISLFIVPKFLVNEDGSLGERNDLRCLSLEHKMGIHASPTCVMSFGENEGALGYLIGPRHGGMRCMFTMMNNARNAVGLQGVSIADRAYQQALAYAQQRVQGQINGQSVPIIQFPDVQRNLMLCASQIAAMRALCYYNAAQIDLSHHHPDPEARQLAKGRVELLTPMVKAWCTDVGCEIASIGVQIHGGMGFVEETGAAQHMRDVRIAPIYEGTNGVQAMDLVGRKLSLMDGQLPSTMLAECATEIEALEAAGLQGLSEPLKPALDAVSECTSHLQSGLAGLAETGFAAAPYLRLFSTTIAGVLLAQSVRRGLACDDPLAEDMKRKASFFMLHVLPAAVAQKVTILHTDQAMSISEFALEDSKAA